VPTVYTHTRENKGKKQKKKNTYLLGKKKSYLIPKFSNYLILIFWDFNFKNKVLKFYLSVKLILPTLYR
jgi:hypothetical protein